MDWLYPLSGFVVGAIVGLTGMGGGSLMTPLLILFFGVHPLTAVGTDLLYAAVTKTAGLAHGNGMFEKLPLDGCRQIIPLQEHGRPKALQDTLLFLSSAASALPITSRSSVRRWPTASCKSTSSVSCPRR